MGFRVDVLRRVEFPDCTNHGITKFRNRLTVVEFDGLPVKGDMEADDDCPAIRIVKRTFGDGIPYYHAEPMERKEGMAGPMNGGNWVVGCCHRWNELVGHRPVPMHDRFEGPEYYNRMD